MNEETSFRDRIGTVDEKGKRAWIFPKKPFGKYTNYRNVVNIILLGLLFAGPHLTYNDRPLMLFDVINRHFILFGNVFWPQDFYLVGLFMITSVVFIILFTVLFGRIFCGWVCPQTIFMEGVFRKIEYWIEGDYKRQKKLAAQPWNREKIIKKGSKHIIFFAISFLIANTFLAYIIGKDELIAIQLDDPMNHLSGLMSLIIFTGVFYFVFSWFREQVCLVACPYGRLQGVMLDSRSIVVAYDYIRGENRGKFRKNEDRKSANKGDCIDCNQCVDVCPTGIDIRNGTQLECVNCTACIDACNHMMKGVGLPEGLIRYASEKEIAEKKPFRWTTRTVAYVIVLFGLISLSFGLFLSRTDVDATVLRVPGQLYQKQGDQHFSNLYNFKVINKTFEDLSFKFLLESHEGEIKFVGDTEDYKVEGENLTEGTFFIILNKADLKKRKSEVWLGLYVDEEKLSDVKVTFMAPL